MVYRRTEREMSAYPHEYEFVKKEGVEFEFCARPVAVHAEGLECARDSSTFVIPADTIVKAIGQQRPPIASALGLETDRGFIRVTESLETSVPGIFAGGDCIRAKGAASTVMAAQDGKRSPLPRFTGVWPMADLSIDFAGIKSPNPFWLASAPPANSGAQVHRAFECGWGGAVWKTIGAPVTEGIEPLWRMALRFAENARASIM